MSADKDAQRIKAMRRVRELNKHLRDLSVVVTQSLAALDAEMVKPCCGVPARDGSCCGNAIEVPEQCQPCNGAGRFPVPCEESEPL